MANSIWHTTPTLEQLKPIQMGTIDQTLGIEIVELGEDYIKGTMPVDERTHQPTGRLHGGANVVLAESLGSLGANLVVDRSKHVCFGMEVNANHLRGVSHGLVTGIARPLHIGQTTQIWEIHIKDDKDRLTCVSRLTMAVVPR